MKTWTDGDMMNTLCIKCHRSEGEHSREALTNPNQHNWKWAKNACPVGDSPFHPTQTFASDVRKWQKDLMPDGPCAALVFPREQSGCGNNEDLCAACGAREELAGINRRKNRLILDRAKAKLRLCVHLNARERS